MAGRQWRPLLAQELQQPLLPVLRGMQQQGVAPWMAAAMTCRQQRTRRLQSSKGSRTYRDDQAWQTVCLHPMWPGLGLVAGASGIGGHVRRIGW